MMIAKMTILWQCLKLFDVIWATKSFSLPPAFDLCLYAKNVGIGAKKASAI